MFKFLLLFVLAQNLVFAHIETKIATWYSKDDKSVIIELTVKNRSKELIFFNMLDHEICGIEIELWSHERGIRLRGKNDAEWRRVDAFVWRTEKLYIKPNESKKFKYSLIKLLPPDPGSDRLAKEIIEEVNFLEAGEGRIRVSYYTDDKSGEKVKCDELHTVTTEDYKIGK